MTSGGPTLDGAGDRLAVTAGGPLLGELRVPGDKSISHRALMLAALADGTSRITGLSGGADVAATATAVAALGAEIESTGGAAFGPGAGATATGGEVAAWTTVAESAAAVVVRGGRCDARPDPSTWATRARPSGCWPASPRAAPSPRSSVGMPR